MPRDRVEEKIDGFIETRILLTRVEQIEKEIIVIQRSKRPQIETVARFLLNPDAAGYLKSLKKRERKKP
jgi:hypothetical protein